jgi:hypothetical protein
MSFVRIVSTLVEVVPRVPLQLALGILHLSCDSIQARACGLPASWLSLEVLSPDVLKSYFAYHYPNLRPSL